MKVGDIIRRKCSTDGAPIGPYMQIMAIKDDRIYADVIGEDEPNIILLKKNVYVCKHRVIAIAERVLDRLKSGEQYAIQHPLCERWNSLLKKPDLITFRTVVRDYRATFVVESVKQTLSLGEKVIRVVVSYKIKQLCTKLVNQGKLHT